MKQTLWWRLTYWPRFVVAHHVTRTCSCHKWPWQTWESK